MGGVTSFLPIKTTTSVSSLNSNGNNDINTISKYCGRFALSSNNTIFASTNTKTTLYLSATTVTQKGIYTVYHNISNTCRLGTSASTFSDNKSINRDTIRTSEMSYGSKEIIFNGSHCTVGFSNYGRFSSARDLLYSIDDPPLYITDTYTSKGSTLTSTFIQGTSYICSRYTCYYLGNFIYVDSTEEAIQQGGNVENTIEYITWI